MGTITMTMAAQLGWRFHCQTCLPPHFGAGGGPLQISTELEDERLSDQTRGQEKESQQQYPPRQGEPDDREGAWVANGRADSGRTCGIGSSKSFGGEGDGEDGDGLSLLMGGWGSLACPRSLLDNGRQLIPKDNCTVLAWLKLALHGTEKVVSQRNYAAAMPLLEVALTSAESCDPGKARQRACALCKSTPAWLYFCLDMFEAAQRLSMEALMVWTEGNPSLGEECGFFEECGFLKNVDSSPRGGSGQPI